MLGKEYVDESEERILNDDYKNWKKSVSFLYDMVMTHALHWPSFTLEWLPSLIRNGTVVKSRLLLGCTTDSDKSHVLLADVYLPSEDDLDPDTPMGTFKTGIGKIELQKRLVHRQAVTRARHMPQRPQIISTTCNNSINIFDTESKMYGITEEELDDFAIIPDTFSKPLLQLSGISSINPTLSWNPSDAGLILGSGDSRSIGLWDICAESTGHGTDASPSGSIPVSVLFHGHVDTVTDVTWWSELPTVFLSSSLDRTVALWDIRSRDRSRPSHSVLAHRQGVASVAASPFSRNIFASGSDDGTMALWDLRNLNLKVHSLGLPSRRTAESVSSVRWSPHSSNLVAAVTGARTVAVWDLDMLHDSSNGANSVSNGDGSGLSADDPPELVFLHGGHSASVRDLCWHPDCKNVLASTASDNIIQIWKPIENLLSSISSLPPILNGPNMVPNQMTMPQQQSTEVQQ